MKPKPKPRSGTKRVPAPVAYPQMAKATTKQVSYADAVKNNSEVKEKHLKKTASFKEYLENLDATSETNYSLWRAARNPKGRLSSPPTQFKGDWARSD
ncbi:hypothetical protein EVAR_91006_1 [Eumeta japonica]|uniref:Uncharacterized protein n=1 Tax=Eumeta variegata TaxID=151549 RepID=A0A4C1SPL7_EUMVA|nr:hypothetical protein EVAR_91006_1 [Eumeta japonica]